MYCWLCVVFLSEWKSLYFYFYCITSGTKPLLLMMSEIFIAVSVVWIFFFFFFLAVSDLNCGTRDLRCSMQDLSLQRRLSLFQLAGLSLVEARGLSKCGAQTYCPAARGILVPWPGIEPVSPALEGRFFTTGPPGKPHLFGFFSLSPFPFFFFQVCNKWKSFFLMTNGSPKFPKKERKRIRRNYYIPIRIIEIKNTDTTKRWWGYRATGTLRHCWGRRMVQLLWKRVWQFLV